MNNLLRYLFLVFMTISALTMPNRMAGIIIYVIGYLTYAVWSIKAINEKYDN